MQNASHRLSLQKGEGSNNACNGAKQECKKQKAPPFYCVVTTILVYWYEYCTELPIAGNWFYIR